MPPKHTQSITYIIIILSMPSCICGGVLGCLENQSKHSKLHQGLNYIVYLLYYIDYDCITVFWKV